MVLRRRTKRKLLVWTLVLATVFIALVAVASASGGGCWMLRMPNGGCFLW